ncbi:MAG: replication-relaxation family protein [Actinomycetota bacterium]
MKTTSELDERDVAILVELARRKILTTEHIHALFFSSLRRAQTKIKELREKKLLTTLPAKGRTKRPDRHQLTDLGTRVAAFHLKRAPSDLAASSDGGLWRGLPHRLGVNDFFCQLVMACDDEAGYGVQAWEDERQIRGGDKRVQADAFGRVLHPGGAVEFLLEYDRGTEHFWAAAEKLDRYLAVSSAHAPTEPTPFPNVLFLVGGPRREQMLSRALAAAVERWDLEGARSATVPFYVANRALLPTEGHLGPVWRPLAGPEGRLPLSELPATPESWWDVSECFRLRWLRDEMEP